MLSLILSEKHSHCPPTDANCMSPLMTPPSRTFSCSASTSRRDSPPDDCNSQAHFLGWPKRVKSILCLGAFFFKLAMMLAYFFPSLTQMVSKKRSSILQPTGPSRASWWPHNAVSWQCCQGTRTAVWDLEWGGMCHGRKRFLPLLPLK